VSLRLAIAGASGRMGQALVEATLASTDLTLAAALDVPDSPALGRDAGERFGRATGVVVGADVEAALAGADVLIDFTRPQGTLAHLAACMRHGVGAVVGTTGFDQAQRREIARAAQSIPIVLAPNMSVGVNVLVRLVTLAAEALGEDYDIEVLEMHHRHKVDAPSGTALALGEAAARGRGVALDAVAQRVRDGITGPRKSGDIGFATLRGGDVAGEHQVIFAGASERLELTHRATTRAIFAKGAVRAARWVVDRPPGLYGLKEVLGL